MVLFAKEIFYTKIRKKISAKCRRNEQKIIKFLTWKLKVKESSTTSVSVSYKSFAQAWMVILMKLSIDCLICRIGTKQLWSRM